MSRFPLPQLFLGALAIGLTLSAGLLALMWVFDIAGFYSAISVARDVKVALVVIWLSNGLLFGALQVGYAMFMNDK